MSAQPQVEAKDAKTVPHAVFQSLATIQQLSFEAGLSETKQQLHFRLLNRTILFCHYDRAVLWDLSRPRPRLLGVSGNSQINTRAPIVKEWLELIRTLEKPNQTTILDDKSFAKDHPAWDALQERLGGLSVLWLPIKSQKHTVAALWLERWRDRKWEPGNEKQLTSLGVAYGIAWQALHGRPRGLNWWFMQRWRSLLLILLAAMICALNLVTIPLRIVAPCEVIPQEPIAVTAPLDGVIDRAVVAPDQAVAKGETLAVYDRRVAEEELKVAQMQVRIARENLARTKRLAFSQPELRSEIPLLEARLRQEETRQEIAAYRAGRLKVTAPAPGTVILEDPNELRGRPTMMGERIMTLVDPQKTKLLIWLPVNDRIEFDQQRDIIISLSSDPRNSRRARLTFLAKNSQITAEGLAAFKAEAEWIDKGDVLLGLEGSAILYGERVSLAYWLFRKPMASLRKYLGI